MPQHWYIEDSQNESYIHVSSFNGNDYTLRGLALDGGVGTEGAEFDIAKKSTLKINCPNCIACIQFVKSIKNTEYEKTATF